jgi:putative ABC transport system substrate-binding protein
MRRREFIAGLGSAAAVWPLAAQAQQPKIRHVGIIDDTPQWNPFRSRLRELGYVEGENIAFDYASGEVTAHPFSTQ